jgi:TPR repeat protein
MADERERLNELKAAAEQGDARAQFNYANELYSHRHYYESTWCPNPIKEALEWLAKAGEQGHLEAQWTVSYIHRYFGAAHYSEGIKWLRKAAKGGLVKAQRELGIMLRDGNGVPKNEKEAVKWFRKAAEQDDRDAQWALGIMLRDGGVRIQKSPHEAAEWFRKALASRDPAKWWHPTRQLEFGIMLRDGNGVPKNEKEATEWLKKTAEHFRMVAEQYSDTYSQWNLGVMLRDGIGIPRNLPEAAIWIRKAAEKYHEAQYALGVMLRDGVGGSKNRREAAKWLCRAASQGEWKAIPELLRMIPLLGSALLWVWRKVSEAAISAHQRAM